MAHVPRERPRVELDVDEKERSLLGCKIAQRAGRAAHRVAVLRLAELVLRAEAHEQHAFRGDVRERAQEQRGAHFAGEVGERRGERALRALIDAARGRRQFLFSMDAEHNAARLRRLGRERLYAKFHEPKVSHDLSPRAPQRIR